MRTVRSASQKWLPTTLGNFFRIKHGYPFKSRYFASDGRYILLTPGNFRENGGLKLKGEKEKYYTGDFPGEYLLRRDDFLVVMTDLIQNAPILGSPAFVPENNRFLHNQRLGKLVDISNAIDRRFLFNLFNLAAVRSQIKATATGSTVRHTAPERIYSVKVEVPPLPVQRKVAAILSAYDDLIENNLRRIKILEDMAELIYREWFVNFRFPGHEKVKFYDSELGKIPEGWEWVTTEEVVKRIPAGKKYDQKTVFPTGDVPVLDQGRSGVIGFHNDEPGVYASPESPVIVFANHTCYQKIVQHPFSAIQNVLPFVPRSDRKRDIFWLHWATKDLIAFNDYKGHWPEFMGKKLLLPDEEVCRKFGLLVGDTVKVIDALERRIRNLRKTRDLLLPRLVSGEVDVEDLDIRIPEEEEVPIAQAV